MNKQLKNRIVSIDILRGIMMVLMALDHVRDYFHIGANTGDPLDLQSTTVFLFFTRWITHFCAPVFIFLSGLSVYLQGMRKSKKELASFVMKRGLWLIFAEMILVSFGWTFNPEYLIIPLQVIWAIGMSMFLLGILLWFKASNTFILALALFIVFGHNVLDGYEHASGFKTNLIWDLLHHGVFQPYTLFGKHQVMLVYPFLAWLGVMLLGYSAGIMYSSKYKSIQRKKLLVLSGAALIVLFMVLRMSNVYGDALLWSTQKNMLFTFLSFINTTKYPPSLLYICMTIGPALIALAFMENNRGTFSNMMVVFGRTAFFYYIAHLYLIHFLAALSFFIKGHTWDEVAKVGEKYPFLFVVPGEGYGLFGVYLIWLLVIILLYPLCKQYDRYKNLHKEKWYLSYL